MKVFVVTFVLGLMLLLSMLINSSIVSDQIRRNAIDQALRLSCYQALQEIKVTNLSEISSEDELKADFIKIFAENIDQSGEYEIQIFVVDKEAGLLDVQVINHYQYLNGIPSEIKVRKTVIYEESLRNNISEVY